MTYSIIIPFFNAAPTLPACVQSALACLDAEILLIDDGSQDNSLEIAGKFGEKHENIRIFHQETGAYPPQEIWALPMPGGSI